MLFGIYQDALKTSSNIKTCTEMFMKTLFTIIKNWKQQRCTQQVKRKTVVYPLHENSIQRLKKKKRASRPCKKKCMNPKCILLSEKGHSEKVIYCIISFI